MKISDTELEGVKLIEPEIFTDHRGRYINLWNSIFDLLPMDKTWKEDDLSVSTAGVIRGFHGDSKTYKMIGCLEGTIFVAVVDYLGPKKNLQWQTFTITGQNQIKLFIPPGYGLAHQVLSDQALFWYKQSEIYSGMGNQFTLHPLDPKLQIPWPRWIPGTYTMSVRDGGAAFL